VVAETVQEITDIVHGGGITDVFYGSSTKRSVLLLVQDSQQEQETIRRQSEHSRGTQRARTCKKLVMQA
jgi:hypothetical protein